MKECVKNWLTAQVGDDEAVLQSLYEDYRGTMVDRAAQARRDIAAADCAALDRTAHALKGAVLTVGDNEILPDVLALRDAAKAGDLVAAAAALDRVEALGAAL